MTGSTRFSYAAAVESGKQVVLVSLDRTALTKEEPKLLDKAMIKWTLDAKEKFHNVSKILDVRQTRLGLEIKVKMAHRDRTCMAKVNLRVLTREELKVLERLLRRFSSFMRGDANRRITKEHT